jgi:hypothetical protein
MVGVNVAISANPTQLQHLVGRRPDSECARNGDYHIRAISCTCLQFIEISTLPVTASQASQLSLTSLFALAPCGLAQGIVRDCRHIRKHSFFPLSQAWSRAISTAQLVHLGDGAGAGILVCEKIKYPYNPLNATHSIIGDVYNLHLHSKHKSLVPGDHRARTPLGTIISQRRMPGVVPHSDEMIDLRKTLGPKTVVLFLSQSQARVIP